MIDLPPKVYTAIFHQLELQRDFHTLFSCALTGKRLALTAIQSLYRIHSRPKAFCSDEYFDENYDANEEDIKDLSKRATLWRSLILSAIGETIYPYCLFIQSLNLRNLRDFITEADYDDYSVLEKFFAEKLSEFQVFNPDRIRVSARSPIYPKVPEKNPTYPKNHLNSHGTVERAGNLILSYILDNKKKAEAIESIESLTYNNETGKLLEWISQLPKLNTLESRSLNPLILEDLAKKITHNCPEFRNLLISTYIDPIVDQKLALFLRTLKQNTLRTLFIVGSEIKSDTFLAINHHADSLKKLKISYLNLIGTEKLPPICAYKNLTSLELLLVHSRYRIEKLGLSEQTTMENDPHQAVIDWICSCHSLRDLAVGYSSDATAIIAQVCSKEWIRLRRLEILSLSFADSKDFFQALSTQTALEYLRLAGETLNCDDDHIQKSLSSLGSLTNLKYLVISPRPSFCRMATIVSLVSYFPSLIEFCFMSEDCTDNLWAALSNLQYLKKLIIRGNTSFTCDGILAFIDSLHPTNQGLRLSLKIQEEDKSLKPEQISNIGDAILEKVDGTFEVRL